MIKSIETSRGIILIREASMADANQFRELRLFALQDNPTAFSADYETNLGHPPVYWQNKLRGDEGSAMFLSENNDNLIGMTGIYRGPSPKTAHSAEIYSVFVHPEWRGLHIAESLIEACIEWARAKAVDIVKLSVNAENESAIRCYQRCGFTIYGTEPKGTFYNGRFYDGHLMSRSLTGS